MPIRPTTSQPPPFPFSGERRQLLTVMFCDLVGYVSLSQRLDPELLRDVKNDFEKACRQRLKRYNGYVAEVPGDALVVYFDGEHDAERSARAALEIVEAVPSVRAIAPLAAHIGIATGEVFMEGRRAYGEPPNLAARLQGVAKPHEVLIAHATRRLLGDAFELSDLGTLQLKGLESRVWRVEGVRRAAARFEAAHGGAALSPLVGRAGELGQLLDNWRLARDGAGRVVLIGGDAGIGKSRLTEALRERVADEEHIELRYQCSPFHLNATLYPVIGQIELKARFAREDTSEQKLNKLERILVGEKPRRSEAAPLLAALLSLPIDRYAPLRLSAAKQKEKTLEVLLAQVEALAAIQPVLMIVEDVHWIDPTSQELIDALVARLEELRVLLIVTYRSDPEQPPYKPRWIKASHVRTITLTHLEADESAELARNVAKGKRLPPEVLNQILGRATGLPLFVEELTKLHLESGLLREEADRYILQGSFPATDIPNTLNAFLIERLDRHKRAKELAQIGACIGRVFSYEVLAAVSGRSEKAFHNDLEQLTRSELLFSRGIPPEATYTFKHALVQDAAYYSLPKRERKRLHALIADVLEKRFLKSVANQPELLAHHRTEADQLTAAIPLWCKAGESALARVALQEAVAYLEKGLALAEQLPPSTDRDLHELSVREPLHTARLRLRGWASREVGVNATAILEVAQRQRRPQSLLVGLWGMWINTITQGRVGETPQWAERLLSEGTAAGDIDLQILGHRAAMSSHFYVGELDKALEQRNAVLSLYEQHQQRAPRWMELTGNDVRTAAGVFGSQALWMLGYPDQAARVCEKKDADSRQLGHPFDIGWALTWGAYVLDYRCEPDRLLECARVAERLGREQSIPVVYNVLVPMVEGLAMLRKGLLDEAISTLRRGISGWSDTGGHLNLPYLNAALAETLASRGDLDAGICEIDKCLEQIERPGWNEQVWLPEVRRLKGWMLMRAGRLAEAETHLDASIKCARQQDARSWELRSSTTLAELLAERGERGAAYKLLEPIYSWFTEGFETHDLKAARSLLDELR